MLRIDYLGLKFAHVKDPTKLFKDDKGPEMVKVKSIYEACKVIFNVTNTLKLEISETGSIYKFTIVSPDYKRKILGYIVYIPGDRRLDVWETGEELPLVQFRVRSIAYRKYSDLLERMGMEKIFSRLITLL